ncbi:MAG: hypothetical protein ACPGYF_00455 [Chitinophagales bacterium]
MGINNIGYFLWVALLVLVQTLLLIPISLWTHGIVVIAAFALATYPVFWNRNAVLVMSFCVGILFDIIYTSGGLHTIAALVTGYFAPLLRASIFDVEALDIKEKWCFVGFNQVRNTIYFGGVSFVYLLVYFALLFFSFQHIFLVISSAVFSSLLTTLFIFPLCNFLRKRLIRG